MQADLEYHEELIGEAKTLFSQEVAVAIKNLSPELQQKIRDHDKKLQLEQEEKIKAAAKAADIEEDEETPDDESSDGCREDGTSKKIVPTNCGSYPSR